jgi:magnesium chelatase subunit D
MTPAERVDAALACLAVDRRLSGLLFIGLPPALLPLLGHRLNAMLADDPANAEIVSLGAVENDDDLWWVPRPVGANDKFDFTMVPGPLIDAPGGPSRTVIIPDLARASLAVTRAAVILLGTDTAVADRYGKHASWQPRSRWLAACARSDLGRLSQHLLDRFAVRVDASGLRGGGWKRHEIRDALGSEDFRDYGLPSLPPPLNLPPRLNLPPPIGPSRTGRRFPPMTDDAIAVVVATVGEVGAPSRRDLALARMARALAVLDSAEVVRDEHVRHAATILGLARTTPRDASRAPPPAAASPQRSEVQTATSAQDSAEQEIEELPPPAGQVVAEGNEPTHPAVLGDAKGSADLVQQGNYAEDDYGSLPEYASLRGPWTSHSRPRARHGRITGTEPTQSLSEMAVVPTAFEAAKFQPLRRRHDPLASGQGLIIWGADLRRYRYLPRPDTAVVLVLDHTCRHDWSSSDFAEALAPYLRWAYVRHAALSVVELGYRGAANEFRATVYRASTVLDGRVSAMLRRAPGRATPLAHALDLSVQEMRRYLRHADVVAENSWLVVVSDGRGNIPLEASQRGQAPGLVTRGGVTDALLAARAMRALPSVRKVVLPPPKLTYYASLPFELAAEMGGIVAETTS